MINVDQLLTVILVIRDRPYYTFRWMDYANKTRFPFKILIADGGKDLDVETRLKDHSNFPNLNYEYLRYPYDASIKDYLCKISSALNQVTTPYVILADDDDFWNVDGIRESVRFLEEHEDYAICRGRNLIFTRNVKNILETTYSPKPIFDATQTLASERVMSIYSHSSWTFYDVHRTLQYQTIFKKIAELEFYFMPMIEIMVGLMDAANGKIKRLECVYLIREEGHGQSTSRSGSYLVRLLTGPCAEQLSAMCHAVAESVAAHENILVDDFSTQLQDTFVAHLAPVMSNHLYAYHDIPFSSVLQNLKTWLLSFLKRKYSAMAKPAQSFAQYLHARKSKKEYQRYLENNPNQDGIFKQINQFLSEDVSRK